MGATKALLLAVLLSLGLACSPRDFLTRRLAADLISSSSGFSTPQLFSLRTGVVSNKDFSSPDSMVLQHRGWISGSEQACPPGVDPPPCWDVVLTPLGVGTVRPLISSAPENGPLSMQVARRELVGISGISKAGNFADVDFTWHWASINPVGAALYDSGVHYRSTVGFRSYDDGWRVVEQREPSNQSLDEALRDAKPTSQ
ncbi:MAG: hypothetical protein ACLQFM_20185 [Terriglobales bacterium]|jgi:hypothetical protein